MKTELAISSEESAKRKYAIDFARGSCRLEGIILEPEIEDFNQLYIDGRMTGEQHTKAVFDFIEKKYSMKATEAAC
jgi:hypothetical protein